MPIFNTAARYAKERFSELKNFELIWKKHICKEPYKCLMCEMEFPKRDPLEKHVWKHYDFKPYICNFCGKRFEYNTYLTVHIWSHTKI